MSADSVKSLTVELRNSSGRVVEAASDTEISLSTTGDGYFLGSADPSSAEVDTVTIPAEQSSVDIYYTQTTSQDITLTVSGDGLTSATAVVYVGAAQIDRYRIISQPESAEIGQSTQVRVEALDAFGNVVILRSGHSLYISTSGA